ncbi:MAG TPA: 30S ribosomal protein S8 [Desulfobacteraceae bacterium]|nr:30S ribosomal protein S8 [Desulfobacteraceae bacterium]
MVMTDPIADMLTRIRNALMVSHETVEVPFSKIKAEILKVMKDEGLIKNFQIIEEDKKKDIRVFLKYDENGRSVIYGLKRISKPGRRIYVRCDKIPRALSGYGVNILSTSQGVMSDREARKKRLGGELLCTVW